jgi:MbtH protein
MGVKSADRAGADIDAHEAAAYTSREGAIMPHGDAEELDDVLYCVVVNDEEQYSIWPAGRSLPAGWKEARGAGTKADCLAYVEQVWTDMRPKSLRERMKATRAE